MYLNQVNLTIYQWLSGSVEIYPAKAWQKMDEPEFVIDIKEAGASSVICNMP